MYVTAIVLAAGKGLRFSRFNSFTVRGGIPTRISKMIESGKSKLSKPLIKINSKPIIIRCLDILSKHSYIKDIIVVANSKNSISITREIKQYRIRKIRDVILGGRLRQNSVINGLKAMDMCTGLVLIHDAVRPFIDKDMVSSLIKEANRYGAAIVGAPVKDTVKKVRKSGGHKDTSRIVEKTLNRDVLWEIQTPQVFKKELILEAYRKFGNIEVTDDASLVEKLGVKVKIVRGSYNNIKITTPDDLILAEAIAKSRNQ
jgi:2-C-methyl-D-erythritol 4-phosphate cytidylyltransferase